MRPKSPRARASVGLGAIGSAMLVAGTTAVAQQPAPAQSPAPTATAAATVKAPATLRVTSRRLNVRVGRTARVSGRLVPSRAGRVVKLQRRGRRGWTTIDKDRTSATGRYVLRHRGRHTGTSQVRVRFAGDAASRSAKRRVGRLNVYRPALASWYGPGLFGNQLGCGGRLGTATIGVAHKSLPCGTRVVLRKGSRIVRARVIDRGPYVGAREFDLTMATKRRLGFGSTGTVLVAH